jgi:uncharacterized membrane protein YbhN (UPF0104 family)
MIMMTRFPSFSLPRAFDVVVMISIVVFFVGYVNIHSDVAGLPHFLPVTEEIGIFWEYFSWIIFSMLAVDVYLKYRKSDSPRSFLKKYWLDVVMLALIPMFAGLKIAKIAIKLVKGLKMAKSGFKVAHGAKKMTKSEKKPSE